MSIDFGIVKKYFVGRGFGFVTHAFLDTHHSEVFFHIKNIKKTHPDLARKLDNEDPIESTYFWYETENSKKGEQVRSVLDPKSIRQKYPDDLPFFIDKIEHIWRDINLKAPDWLDQVTLDLVGPDRTNELSAERDNLEHERKEANDRKRREQEARQRIEDAKREKLIEEQRAQQEIEDKEFEQLVEEMAALGFIYSNQVSSYIMRNRLGYKYRNISGVVKMAKDGDIWDFNGGFPPEIYAKLCSELGLSNQGTEARAVGFTPFKELPSGRFYKK